MTANALDGWIDNPDVDLRELERLAAAGDERAARELASALFRSGRLTVQELARIGEPAVEVLPQDLARRLYDLLKPRWQLVHTGTDMRDGDFVSTRRFWSEEAAWQEAARRLMPIMEREYQDHEWSEDHPVHNLVGQMRNAWEAGEWEEVVGWARELKADFDFDYDEDNRLEVEEL